MKVGAALVLVTFCSRSSACRVLDGTVVSVDQASIAVQKPLASTTGHEVRVGDATFTCYVYDVKAGRLSYSDGKPVVNDPFVADVLRQLKAGSEPPKRWAITVRAVSQRPFAGDSYLSSTDQPRHVFISNSGESDNAYRFQFATVDVARFGVDHVDVRYNYAQEWKTIGTYDIRTRKSQGLRFHARLKLFGVNRAADEPWAKVHVRMRV